MISENKLLNSTKEALAYLDDLRRLGMKLGIENPRRLAQHLGSPQSKLNFIHVAGTNGKGSVCAMLESIYRAAGHRVGLFTSPHLVDLNERIQVNRKAISDDHLLHWVNVFRDALSHFPETRPTFFEALVIIALLQFQHENCDLIIWETGLGGRLDATNIVNPLLTIITNIGLDHQRWLGDDLETIAAEKAGILKRNIPLIHGVKSAKARNVIEAEAERLGSRFSFTEAAHLADFKEIGLEGKHQKDNAALAIQAVEWLSQSFPVSENAKSKGLKETYWAGRLQRIFRGKQEIFLDGAHNQTGIEALCEFLKDHQFHKHHKDHKHQFHDHHKDHYDHHQFHKHRPTFLFGTLKDKGLEKWLPLLVEMAEAFFLVPVKGSRTISPKSIQRQIHQLDHSIPTQCCECFEDAFCQAINAPLLIVCGSLYLIGEALQTLGDLSNSKVSSSNVSESSNAQYDL